MNHNHLKLRQNFHHEYFYYEMVSKALTLRRRLIKSSSQHAPQTAAKHRSDRLLREMVWQNKQGGFIKCLFILANKQIKSRIYLFRQASKWKPSTLFMLANKQKKPSIYLSWLSTQNDPRFLITSQVSTRKQTSIQLPSCLR